MAGLYNYKFSDAFHRAKPVTTLKKSGRPAKTHEITAEQTREANESKTALNAEASIRDQMVKIGRGNQQAGRQGQ
jgi:hypothetical protein